MAVATMSHSWTIQNLGAECRGFSIGVQFGVVPIPITDTLDP